MFRLNRVSFAFLLVSVAVATRSFAQDVPLPISGPELNPTTDSVPNPIQSAILGSAPSPPPPPVLVLGSQTMTVFQSAPIGDSVLTPPVQPLKTPTQVQRPTQVQVQRPAQVQVQNPTQIQSPASNPVPTPEPVPQPEILPPVVPPQNFPPTVQPVPDPVPTPIVASQNLPPVVQGPANSQLVGIQAQPSYTSPLGAYLGLDSRESSNAERSQYFTSSSRRRVVKVPEMFGDYRRFSAISSIDGEVSTFPPPATSNDGPSTLEVPNAGGISGLKIGENNQAITADRLWFSYNRMYDALDVPTTNGFQGLNVDRFTVGWEKTLRDGDCSIEIRMPLAGNISNDLNFDPGVIGDVSLIFKKMLFANDRRATSCGLGIELPTGDDSYIWTPTLAASLDSDTVFLVPYFMTSQLLSERSFLHFFTQLSIPTGEDDLYIDYSSSGPIWGTVRAPTTTSIDVAIGHWLFPPRTASDSGLALLLEGHYTARLDAGEINVDGINFNQTNLNSLPEHVLNVTTAAHAQMSDDWSLRLGYSVPVTEDQLFQSELIFQILHSK